MATLILTALLLSGSVRADAGIPMLALAWPALWALLVPVVIVEAVFARRRLLLSWRESFRLSAIANLWSTFAGVPLTWLVLLVVEMLFGELLSGGKAPSSFWDVLLFPFMAAWIGPSEKSWPVYAAGAVLCIPFGLVSIWIEAKVGVRRLGTHRRKSVTMWSRVANGTTYGAMFLVLAGMAAVDWAGHK